MEEERVERAEGNRPLATGGILRDERKKKEVRSYSFVRELWSGE